MAINVSLKDITPINFLKISAKLHFFPYQMFATLQHLGIFGVLCFSYYGYIQRMLATFKTKGVCSKQCVPFDLFLDCIETHFPHFTCLRVLKAINFLHLLLLIFKKRGLLIRI